MIYKFSEGSVVDLSKVVGMQLVGGNPMGIVLYFDRFQVRVNFHSQGDGQEEDMLKWTKFVNREYEDVCEAYKKLNEEVPCK